MLKSFSLAALANLAASASLQIPQIPYYADVTQDQLKDFMGYLAKFGKNYNKLGDFQARAKRYVEVDTEIKEWNANPKNTHKLGHNKFSDWSKDEYKAMLTY